MKRIYCCCLFFLPIFAGAQHIQLGWVFAYRTGKPVPNVQIEAGGAAIPTTTDDAGMFRLIFTGKRPGDPLNLTVKKAGYEWVNREKMERALISAGDRIRDTIIMALPGEVAAAKIKIYNVTGVILEYVFKQRTAALNAELRAGKISNAQWEIQVKELQAALEASTRRKDELAEFAARFYTTGNDLGNRLLTLLETGEIDEAIQALRANNIVETANRLLKARQAMLPGPAADSLEQLIDRHVQLLTLATKIYTLYLDTKMVEVLYAKILQLQPDNPEALKEIAVYYRLTGRYRDALQLFRKLRLLLPDMRLRARALSFTADVYRDMGFKDSAQYYYTRYLDEVQILAQADSGNTRYRQELATSEKRLGTWYQSNHQVKAAIQHYQAAERITATISGRWDSNDTAWAEHVNSLATLGKAWALVYRYDSAVACFDKGRQILEPLYNYISLKQYIEPQLAGIYYLLGETFYQAGNYDQALLYMQKALVLYEKELSAAPASETSVLQAASGYRLLANIYSYKKDADRAVELYQRTNTLHESIEVKNPLNVTNKYHWALACGDAAFHYYRNKTYRPGIRWAGQYYAISAELFRQYPQAPEYGYLYAQALYAQALLLKKTRNKRKAAANFHDAIRVLENVLHQSPGDYQVMARLGECYWHLGTLRIPVFWNRRLAGYYYEAARYFDPLCTETGNTYFCRMLNSSRNQAVTAWPFRVKKK